MKGRVIKSTGSWYSVLLENESVVNCRLRGKFKLDKQKVTNPVTVGDWVEILVEPSSDTEYIITDIYPRDNYIIRKSPKKMAYGHLLASNIDLAVLVASVVYPKTSTGFIDRFLVTAEAYRIPSLILFNKKDLWDDEAHSFVEEMVETYKSIGYSSLIMSSFDDVDVQKLREVLHGKTSLFSGHSGVGKSTLLNKLTGSVTQKTQEVSDFANKGVHTTTFAEMFEIEKNTFVIDTPGIKELALAEIEEEELSHYFPEMRELIGQCKYHNCTHTHEPGCAIVEALDSGKVPASRYNSYLSMYDDEDNRR
ncbi:MULTISPECIES: ribosome small subunit-dependent GTPase A [unclassified Imperialibacter]|uniref:ribosome small subunit-dependent GTPase A n=1 Tax=unclassified Imperialibacter TaxID=2629706 RepID=UPI001255505A|nr:MULTISPECIES: ribosome small subunit-dependent GTPase A [unclassified Imperialibacter]CAD5266877.1 Small ribosomal subunit biogenesis GTPase RsgA [Imperialibacter sp. 75]CAD5297138.1 Small ribosomal subunit biogenesis GTPase RsgA [Imperialibacter sp. 89]VVT27222.1 Small ribosomal subunit biogenesis GTPase RsgA [Imperialibacter sp. EC-SDR9]